MKKTLIASLVAGVVLLILSYAILYVSIFLFPKLVEEYYSPVFRVSGPKNWIYFAHPFILSIALKWFWERYKSMFKGNFIFKAMEVSLAYCVVAMIPVLWLTFSAINISFPMVVTWLLYGMLQAFVAGLIFAKMNP